MKYGIYYAYWEKSWGCDYRKYVKKVRELGFDILEISCAGLKEMLAEEIEELNKCRQEYGIRLTAGYGPKKSENIADEDLRIVETGFQFWRETFPVMKQLGINTVGGGLYGYWPVDYTKPINKEADITRSINNMRKLADMANEYEIELCMEVLNRHEGYMLNTAEECVRYVEAVGRPNVKVMLDTYHMCLEEDDMLQPILKAGKLLGRLHVGENNRRLPMDETIIDWKKIGTALRQIGYQGDVVMEPFVIRGGEVGRDIRIWRDMVNDTSELALDEAARKSLIYLKQTFEGT